MSFGKIKLYCLFGTAFLLCTFACGKDEPSRADEQDGHIPSLDIVEYDFTQGRLSDSFILDDASQRYCVAGGTLEIMASFHPDIPCALALPDNVAEAVAGYNEKYCSNSILLPSQMYSLACSRDGDKLKFVLNVNQDRVREASSSISYILPLCVKTADETLTDVFYAFVPTYTVNGGMVTVHLSSYATLDIYYADKSNDKAVIYCPGGGYSSTSLPDMDTNPVFRDAGVTVGVLWYRTPSSQWQGRRELPLTDVSDALSVMKAHSSQWGGYGSFGIAGRSAGGHLAAVSAAYNKEDFDFQILLYPVITMEPGKTHNGSLKNFLGTESPSRELIDAWSAEKLVTLDTPRAFVAYSINDSVVPQEYNGKAMSDALRNAGVSHLAKEYPQGGHSINWPDFPSCLHEWLKKF